jgi:chromatin segregation and condensation protein Rec8/ScpA/Scc1 (kleisin family)
MTEVQSRFLFDGLVFNPEYFREKMAESRKRREQKREEVRKMLAGSRSDTLELDSFDLDSVPDLIEALNQLTNIPENLNIDIKSGFDLRRYEQHVRDHLKDYPVNLTDIPTLSENPRKDLIWRFIAVIFLAHAGTVDVIQDGQQIKVKRHEIDREGQDIFGESEETDGIEGSVGRAEAG